MTIIPQECEEEIREAAISIARSKPGEPKHRILEFAREVADLSCEGTYPGFVLDKEDPDSVLAWMSARNAAIYALSASIILNDRGLPE